MKTKDERLKALGVVTHNDYPPIPTRDMDWSCVSVDYDGAEDAGPQIMGHGATEVEALADYYMQVESSLTDQLAAAHDRERQWKLAFDSLKAAFDGLEATFNSTIDLIKREFNL